MTHLEDIKKEYDYTIQKLSNPETISDHKKFGELSLKRNQLEEVVKIDKQLQEVKKWLEENKKLVKIEDELSELAQAEIPELEKKENDLSNKLKSLIINLEEDEAQKQTGSTGNSVILEIRAGTGGDEASLFAGDLYNMYFKFSQTKNWEAKILDSNKADIGGFKSLTAKIKGKNVFSLLKYEGGVHRVQRVPETEKGGRIHTSTVSVAVLPEPDKKTDIEILPKDLRIDTYRASGPGGQYVNTCDSAVRITHTPTGLIVSSQNERSQLQNKETALSILKAKLLEYKIEKMKEKEEQNRKSQIGQAKRSEKIRTYNFTQDRITDHRIETSWHNIETILQGDISQIINALREKEEIEKYERIKIN